MPEKPCFIKEIPPGHYLGISAECPQLAKAQEDSLYSVTKQILQQIGAEYQLEFEKLTYSKNYQTDITVNDKFSFSSSGILPDIEVKKYFYEKVNNRYVFYTLAYFPRPKIIQARKLIELEHNKRLAQYNSFIRKGKATESNEKIIDALHQYRMAMKQAEVLFKERQIKKATVNSYIENLLSRIRLKPISNYNQRDNFFVSCKTVYDEKPISDIPVRFQLSEGNGFITPLVYSDLNGIAKCDVNMKSEISSNKIKTWIDLGGVDSGIVFSFSTIKPKPIVKASFLEVKNNCFAFSIKECNDIDVVFDKYEIHINAEYKNASFINYYITHVDNNKHASSSFNLLNQIKIRGGTHQPVKIPFNSWLEEQIDELDKWYMGSKIDYKIVLRGNNVSIPIQ